jgi:hypothetical protein
VCVHASLSARSRNLGAVPRCGAGDWPRPLHRASLPARVLLVRPPPNLSRGSRRSAWSIKDVSGHLAARLSRSPASGRLARRLPGPRSSKGPTLESWVKRHRNSVVTFQTIKAQTSEAQAARRARFSADGSGAPSAPRKPAHR